MVKVGVIGAIIAALCCVTPLLPWLLSTVGLTGVIGYVYRDAVLLPLAAIFLAIAGYGLWQRKRAK